MSKFQLIALDLDGTLLNTMGTIPQQNIDAIYNAQKTGIKIAFCTGRNFFEAKEFCNQLKKPIDWLITSNGAYICDYNGNNVIFNKPLSNNECNLLFDICREFETDPCFYDINHLFYGNTFNEFFIELNKKRNLDPNTQRKHSTHIKGDKQWKNILNNNDLPFIKAIIYHKNEEYVNKIIQKLQQINIFELTPSIIFGGFMQNVEISKKDIHKGNGLQILCEHIDIDIKNVIALGDSDNDITMLKMAGLGIAMDNASQYIKSIANESTLSNNDFGVAHAIKKHIL